MDRFPGGYAIQLRIELDDVEPTVWRRLLIPGDSYLSEAAEALVIAMSWQNSHLHQFEVGDSVYGMHADDYPEEEIDESSVAAIDAFRSERRFTFVYDFGDNWEHEVTVEEISWTDPGIYCAVCLGGENACPPEDCGGTGGYRDFLEAIADAGHKDHGLLLDWVGGAFDAAAFSVASVNAELQAC